MRFLSPINSSDIETLLLKPDGVSLTVWRNILAVLLGLVVILTTTGNLFILVAFATIKHFQTSVSNLYIASLAAADLIVGSFVMVMMMSYVVVHSGTWTHGAWLCDLWQVLDFYSCTVSLYSICAIALDRWFNLEKPLRIFKRSRKNAQQTVLVIWIVPFLIWVPVYVSSRAQNQTSELISELTNQTIIDPHHMTCFFDWSPHRIVPGLAVPFFYIPVVLLVLLFARISMLIASHMKFLRLHSNHDSLRGSMRQLDEVSPAPTTPNGRKLMLSSLNSLKANVSNFSPVEQRPGVRRPSAARTGSLDYDVLPDGTPLYRGRQKEGTIPEVHENGHMSGQVMNGNVVSVPNSAAERRRRFSMGRHSISAGSHQNTLSFNNSKESADASLNRQGSSGGSGLTFEAPDFKGAPVSQQNSPSPLQKSLVNLSDDQRFWDRHMRQPLLGCSSNGTTILENRCVPVHECRGHLGKKRMSCASVNSDSAFVAEQEARKPRPPPLLRAKTETILEFSTPEQRRYSRLVGGRLRYRSESSLSRKFSLNNFFAEVLIPATNSGVAQQIRAARAVGVIMLCFLACWLPFMVMWPWKVYCGSQSDCGIPERSYHLAIWANYLNSAMNPLLYALCSPRFKSVMRDHLSVILKRKVTQPKSSARNLL